MNKTLFAVLTIFLLSCGTDRIAIDDANRANAKSHDFKSIANGMADIRLSLNPDQTFTFYMRTMPQPMTDEEETDITSTGTWTEENNWVRLNFKKDVPNLNAVFDARYADNNQAKIVDINTVDINIELDELSIWGVICKRIEN